MTTIPEPTRHGRIPAARSPEPDRVVEPRPAGRVERETRRVDARPTAPPGGHGDTFEPIQMIRIDLAEPLAPLVRGATRDGRTYRRGRVLVLVHGVPLGVVWVGFDGESIPPAELAPAVVDQLGDRITAHVGAHGPPSAVDPPTLLAGVRCGCRTPEPPVEPASVVVATRGRPESLWLALESLLCSDHPDFEIIVVDNSPEDPRNADLIAEKFADEPRVRLVPEPRRGLSHARNRGLRAARNDIVAFTDDDVTVTSTWLGTLVSEFTPGVGCVTGLVEPMELETECQWWFECAAGFGNGYAARRFHLVESPDQSPLFPYKVGGYGAGASMSLRRSAMPGWEFDTALGAGSPAQGGEDLDLFLDVLMREQWLVYQPAAISSHRHRSDREMLDSQMGSYGAGLTGMLTKRLLRRPAERRLLLSRIAAGVRHAVSPQFRADGAPDVAAAPYPRSLRVREAVGMGRGPFAYVGGLRRSGR